MVRYHTHVVEAVVSVRVFVAFQGQRTRVSPVLYALPSWGQGDLLSCCCCSAQQPRRHSALGYQSPEVYQRTVTTPVLAVAK